MPGCSSIKKVELLLPPTQDRVLGGFGHAELYDALGGNLDGLSRGRITTHAGFPVHEHDFAQAGNREGVFGVLVCQFHQCFQGL
jgi:hypothetical protein